MFDDIVEFFDRPKDERAAIARGVEAIIVDAEMRKREDDWKYGSKKSVSDVLREIRDYFHDKKTRFEKIDGILGEIAEKPYVDREEVFSEILSDLFESEYDYQRAKDKANDLRDTLENDLKNSEIDEGQGIYETIPEPKETDSFDSLIEYKSNRRIIINLSEEHISAAWSSDCEIVDKSAEVYTLLNEYKNEEKQDLTGVERPLRMHEHESFPDILVEQIKKHIPMFVKSENVMVVLPGGKWFGKYQSTVVDTIRNELHIVPLTIAPFTRKEDSKIQSAGALLKCGPSKAIIEKMKEYAAKDMFKSGAYIKPNRGQEFANLTGDTSCVYLKRLVKRLPAGEQPCSLTQSTVSSEKYQKEIAATKREMATEMEMAVSAIHTAASLYREGFDNAVLAGYPNFQLPYIEQGLKAYGIEPSYMLNCENSDGREYLYTAGMNENERMAFSVLRGTIHPSELNKAAQNVKMMENATKISSKILMSELKTMAKENNIKLDIQNDYER